MYFNRVNQRFVTLYRFSNIFQNVLTIVLFIIAIFSQTIISAAVFEFLHEWLGVGLL